MTANREKNYPLYIEALKLKLKGKTYQEIADIQGITKNGAWKRVQIAKVTCEQECTIDMKKLAEMMLGNTIGATEQETRFLNQLDDKDKIETSEIQQAGNIKTSRQKIHAFLAGENSTKDGGEREIKVIKYADTL